ADPFRQAGREDEGRAALVEREPRRTVGQREQLGVPPDHAGLRLGAHLDARSRVARDRLRCLARCVHERFISLPPALGAPAGGGVPGSSTSSGSYLPPAPTGPPRATSTRSVATADAVACRPAPRPMRSSGPAKSPSTAMAFISPRTRASGS